MVAILSRPQCVNSLLVSDAILHQSSWSELFWGMVCWLLGAKPSPEPMLTYIWLDNLGTSFSEILIKIHFVTWKCIWKVASKMVNVLCQFQYVVPNMLTPGIILCMRPANERWRYNVTPSLIGWACTQNDPCNTVMFCTAMYSGIWQ